MIDLCVGVDAGVDVDVDGGIDVDIDVNEDGIDSDRVSEREK